MYILAILSLFPLGKEGRFLPSLVEEPLSSSGEEDENMKSLHTDADRRA